MAQRRVTGDDEAWADLNLGDCASGSIHELREAIPRGKPFEPVNNGIGFLVHVGDTLVPRHKARRQARRKKRS